jgi:hypothetical protein
MRLPQKTWNPKCYHVESMAIISFVIFPLFRSILSTLCWKMRLQITTLQIMISYEYIKFKNPYKTARSLKNQ